MSKWCRAAAGVLKATAETQSRRSYHTIQAVPREISGHRISVRDRAQGRIPAVVFSQRYVQRDPNDPTSVVASSSVSRKLLLTTEQKQIQAILKHIQLPFFCSTTFPLQIRAGYIQMKMGRFLNLVFVWAEDGTQLKVDVPIVYKGEDVCLGIKKGWSNSDYILLYCGGRLSQIRTSLKYLCPAEHIPAKIEVDLSNLDIGDSVSMHDVSIHPSLKLLSKNENLPVCKIMATDIGNFEHA
ncbi:UNVERIFIED_CONTAM: 50S ribosomal protein L25 [Sesamum radiatum]|uniref:50S ribosomal protein L25 n=1 Tax=Sesamum radiatum TaxID=300843 RepID=A0AAW2RCH2_SESRA